jgi:hypothetical protein
MRLPRKNLQKQCEYVNPSMKSSSAAPNLRIHTTICGGSALRWASRRPLFRDASLHGSVEPTLQHRVGARRDDDA